MDSLLVLEKQCIETLPLSANFSGRSFKVGPGSAKLPRIIRLGEDFQSAFSGINFPKQEGTRLSAYRLTAPARDEEILRFFGIGSETPLFAFFDLLCLQGQGQKGVLAVNGNSNIFFIRDWSLRRWTVFCLWFGGWLVSTNPFDDEYGWNEGKRVFRTEFLQ